MDFSGEFSRSAFPAEIRAFNAAPTTRTAAASSTNRADIALTSRVITSSRIQFDGHGARARWRLWVPSPATPRRAPPPPPPWPPLLGRSGGRRRNWSCAKRRMMRVIFDGFRDLKYSDNLRYTIINGGDPFNSIQISPCF